ncbi:MAG: four-helix bundle copper-binding protein [Nonlabens sp.]
MKNQDLINALTQCITHCNYCANACLGEENVKMMSDCIRTDIACAEVCSTALKLVSSNSKFTKSYLQICIEVCDACTDECSKHDHQHCQDCAEACRKCAETCKSYLA